MGTNFFWIVTGTAQRVSTPMGEIPYHWSSYDPIIHIGKRSAAGLYCWDCRTTLCEQGESQIHHAGSVFAARCPHCGKSAADQNLLREGAAAIELGLAAPNSLSPTGVRTASSFAWAQDPERVRKICSDHRGEILIEDGYGRRYTCGEFLTMLEANCPIEFTDSIGHEFS